MYELKIKDTRLKKGVTQKEVAELLGISQSYISRIEKKVIKNLKIVMKVWLYEFR